MTKMRSSKKPTWLNYLNTLKDQTSDQDQKQLVGFDNFFSAGLAHPFFKYSIPFIYLLDYKGGTYIKISEDFAGYKSEVFLNEGINHTLEIYHRDHLKLFNTQIFPDRLQILKNIKPDDHKNHIFTYDVSVKNSHGKHEKFLQRSCFLSDAEGNPIYSMGILINVNHFMEDRPIIQTVDKIGANGLFDHKTIEKRVYYLNEEDKIFSMREKEVLLWMADGLSSKMIADKLHVSEHTVINHRRNMHDKTNTPNAIALVSFAIKNRII